MPAVTPKSAPRNPVRLPNGTPPGNGGTRQPNHVNPDRLPKDLRTAPGNGQNLPKEKTGKPSQPKPNVKPPIGDPKKRLGASKKLIQKGLKKLAVKGAGKLLGALGGPVGMAAVTCADIAYEAGQALGRRDHPTTPADPGGNKILRKQPDGTYKWVPGPNKPIPKNTPKANLRVTGSPYPSRLNPTTRRNMDENNARSGHKDMTKGGQQARDTLELSTSKKKQEADFNSAQKKKVDQEHAKRMAAYATRLAEVHEIRRRWKKPGDPWPPLPKPEDFGSPIGD